MSKLSAKREREIRRADPALIRARARQITQSLPPKTGRVARARFVIRARRAVEDYLSYLPRGIARPRKHRPAAKTPHSAKAHRPRDAVRRGLVGDLYEAWISACGANDPDAVRGFKLAADAVLEAAGLPPVTEREQRYIRELIAAFASAFIEELVGRLKGRPRG